MRRGPRFGDCIGLAPTATAASHLRLLPMAEAARLDDSSASDHWDPQQLIMTMQDDASKARFIGELRNFLIDQGLTSEIEANRFEFIWRQRAADAALFVAPATRQLFFSRGKRISHANREHQIAEHIKNTCAYETEIINTEGVAQGQVLLVYAQRAENPFHQLLENNDGKAPGDGLRHSVEGANFVTDVVTFGIKSVIGNMIAGFLRRKHYLEAGDKICADRHLHLMFAQVATSLVVDGLPLKQPSAHLYKPAELLDIDPLVSNAAYFARNRNFGVQTEVLLKSTAAGTAEDGIETIFLKPQGEASFVAVQAEAGHLDDMQKIVVYDEEAKVWRFANSDRDSPIEVELFLGETFVTIGGEQYQLHQTKDMQYEIAIRRKSGQYQYLLVYREPISNNWYLRTSDHHARFSPRQRTLINTLRVRPEADNTYTARLNKNPELYGDGRIYDVARKDGSGPGYSVVEMNGELVPVRQIQLEGHAVQYEAYSLQARWKKGFRVEWDGEFWHPEKATSPHICSVLKQYISPDMYAMDIRLGDLSRPDSRGVRHSSDGRRFIKVNRHFVEIHDDQKLRKGAPFFLEIKIEYKDHQFHLAPGGVLSDVLRQAQHSSSMSEFYHRIKEDAKSVGSHQLTYKRAVNVAKAMFPNEKGDVRQIASADLNKRRYVFSDADEEIWFLESTPDGRDHVLLGHLERQKALGKYQARATGGAVQQAFTIRQAMTEASGPAADLETVRSRTGERIEAGWQLIREILVEQKKYNPKGETVILGPDDFFGGASVATNAYAAMDTTYELMVKLFIPLSRRFPDAIIAPGSICISQDISWIYRANQNTYRQDGLEVRMENAVHFSASIAPVFHGGKIVAIARQGEYLTYHAASAKPQETAGTALHTLDYLVAPRSVFDVHCYRGGAA